MQDYKKEQWEIDLAKSLEGFTEDYLNQVTDGKLKQLQGAKNGGYAASSAGAHLKGAEASKLTNGASNGGKKSISKLLQWQKDNEHNIGEIAKIKDEEWCNKISESLTGRKLSKEHIQNSKKGMKKYIESLSSEERSEKFSNHSASNKSLRIRTEILNMIEGDTFTTSEARKACDEYGLGNWKSFLKDNRIIKQIYKGTNQNNPSIYEKLK